jgi:hypothetical protein
MTELIKALLAFHQQVPSIAKTGKAQYGAYADLETVLSVITPALTANGLIVSQCFEPGLEHDQTILVTKLIHENGAELVSRLPMVIGKGRNPLHDWGGSCTYSRRYSLLAILGLTADMDTDGNLEGISSAAESKPAPKIEGVADDEQPLTQKAKETIGSLIADLKPDKKKALCEKFREDFGLSAAAKVMPAITAKKHQDWMNANIGNFTE